MNKLCPPVAANHEILGTRIGTTCVKYLDKLCSYVTTHLYIEKWKTEQPDTYVHSLHCFTGYMQAYVYSIMQANVESGS